MSIAYNATDAFNAGGSSVKATSATGTIPSGAGIGDVLFMVFQASDTATTLPATTLSVTSTGNAWTQIGATQACAISSFANCKSSIWWLAVQAADQGATVTVHSTASLYLAAAAAGYSGVSTTTPVDASAFTIASAGQETIPTGTVTSSAASDWLLYLASVTSNTSIISVTKPSSCTLRESYFAYNEVYCGVADLNTTSGSGTVGGASWTCGAYSGYVMWTVAILAQSAAAVTDAGAAADQVTAQVTGIPVVLITAPPRPAGPAPAPVRAQILTVPQGNAVPADAAGAAEVMTAGTVTVPLADVAGAADTISGGVFPSDQAAAAEAMTVTAVTAALGEVAAASDLNTAAAQVSTSDYAASTDLNQTTGLTQSDAAGAADALTAHVTLSLTDKAAAAEGYGTEPAIGASGGATRPQAMPGTSQVAVAAPGTSRWYYLGSLGQVTALSYSFVCPGGADAMSCTVMVPASYRTQLFDPGWQVRITRGGHQVWSGKLDEPVPTASGWNLTAVGDGNRGQDFLAVYSSTWPANQPDESINGAVTRGLPWVNPGVGQPSGAWFGQAADSGAQTIAALLGVICTRGGLTWYANSQPGGYPGTDLSVFPLPATPNRLLVCTTPVARTLAADINTIYLRYQVSAASTGSGGSGAATYGLTSAQNAASVAMHGELETYIDLSNAGTMSAGAAQAVGNNVLAIYQRASFAGPFVGNYGALMNMGGVPVDPGTDQAGTVCRLILADFGYGGEVVPGPVQFITGRYEWNDFTQQFSASPYQSVDQSLTGLLSLENTVLAPVAVPSGITGG